MQASKELLQILENKLKVANIRSPYLNAIVGRSRNRVDLLDFDALGNVYEGEVFSKTFLRQLMQAETNGELQLLVDTSRTDFRQVLEEDRFRIDVLLKRLKALHFDKEEDWAEHGTRSFGFGYPLLAFRSKQDKKKVLIAPLIIWYLDIQMRAENHNAFKITRKAEDPVILNPQLISFLQTDMGITLDSLPEDYLEDDCLSQEELEGIIETIKDQLHAFIVNFEEGPVSVKDKGYYDHLLTDHHKVFNSGIFSLFKSNRESIVSDYQDMINGKDDMMFDDSGLYAPYQEDYFSAVPLDPSQEGILRNISEHKKVIIQGPPGTGKSNSLTGIILNALENKASVLVVCEKKTALDVLYANLKEKDMDEFCVVIDNVHSDRQKVVKSIRDKLDIRAYEQTSQTGLMTYYQNKKQFMEHYHHVLEGYQNLMNEVIGDMNWKDCIGNYLKAERQAGHGKDKGVRVDVSQLTYSESEFYSLLETIREGAFLKDKINDVSDVFQYIRSDFFSNELTTASLRNIEEQMGALFTTVNGLVSKWETVVKSHPNPDQLAYPGIFARLTSFLNKQFRQQIRDAQNLLKETGRATDQIAGVFVDLEVPSRGVSELMESLKRIDEILSAITRKFSRFREFHHWKNFYLQAEHPLSRDLMDALSSESSDQWESIFRMWYFNQLLMDKEIERGVLPSDSRSLHSMMELEEEIDRSQQFSIRQRQYERQRDKIKGRTLQELRMLFNLRSNKRFGKRNSLRSLYHQELDIMQAFFPVLMVNPVVSSSILPLKAGLFDLVIFDEASQLKLEDTFPALMRGRFKIISGDIHQMPPSTYFASSVSVDGNSEQEDVEDDVVFSEEESLLTYAQNADFEFNYLDFHYRSRHPWLIDFSNAAFYGQRLVAMPAISVDKPIEIRELGGIYDNHTNALEADEVIRIVFEEIQVGADGQWPSVGVATLNLTQQRYIWERIWEITDKNDVYRERLTALESAGFFIKNLENIQGDERDIIIITTTFGERPDGKFIQNFGPLNREKGYKLLNVIVTRARNKIYLLTSIPRDMYLNFRDDIITKGTNGKGIFYAYITYARLCSEGDEHGRRELLEFLRANSGDDTGGMVAEKKIMITESPFEEEVLQDMLGYLAEHYVETQFELGGFRLDMVVKDRDFKPRLVIECDGKTYHKSKVAHRYDIHRQRILERHGLVVYRIWSTNWWRDRGRESMLLKNFIMRELPNLG
jgi:very-short-patch-repair endonuclease